MDYKINKETLLKLTNQEVMDLFKTLFPVHELYSMSVDWRNGNYILKLRGTQGDLVIGWN